MSDKLTPERIAAIEWQLAGYRARIATWGGLGTEHAQDATADIAALLSHVAALVNEDGRGEYPVAEAWRGYAEAAEERAQEAERKLDAEREAHRALVVAARAVIPAIMLRATDFTGHACPGCGWFTRNGAKHNHADGCSVGALADALAALEAQEGESHE